MEAEATLIDFSVVICTYNGENRLPKVLQKLRSQQTSCHWEILIIDNNSCDRTATVIHDLQANWLKTGPQAVPFRYCFEPTPGLAFARRRAIAESRSPLIGFLDDDTLPTTNWVSAAFNFAQQHPQAGAYGSSIEGLYETPPPPNFDRIACCLAIINRGHLPFQYSPKRGVLPAGAGMVVRKQAWLEQVPAVPALSGVKAGSLKAKGEDIETLSYIRKHWEIWHNPAMQLQHVIPDQRLKREYLLELCWQIGLSRYRLRQVQYSSWQWPLMVGLYALSDCRKVLLYCLRNLAGLHNFSSRWNKSSGWNKESMGTVAICEFALLLGSLLSPVIYWRDRLPKRTNRLPNRLNFLVATNQKADQSASQQNRPSAGQALL